MAKLTIRDQIFEQTQRLFLNNFGAAPDHLTVSMDDRCMVIHIQNFIGSVMETLVTQHDKDAMRTTRELIVDYMIPDLIDCIKLESGIEFDSFYYDWDDSDLSGLIVGIFSSNHYRDYEDYYRCKDQVHHQVGKITYDIQRMPDQIYSYWVDRNALVVVREGLLIKIEKELVNMGFSETLRKSKRSLEKTSFITNGGIPETVKRVPIGFYVDWNFVKDKSVMVYIFEEEA